MTRQIGFLLFPAVQQLDLTGPYDVLAALPDTKVHLVWKDLEPVRSSTGLRLLPDVTYETCPKLDALIVPGGTGINDAILDAETVAFVRKTAETVRYLGSVCTGALLLGVAGCLKGKKATTHWRFHELLSLFDATPVKERVVRDGKLLTGGGITAGIDFALTMAAEMDGEDVAMAIQLNLEYAPAPPFDSGSPDTAPKAVLDRVMDKTQASFDDRRERIKRALKE